VVPKLIAAVLIAVVAVAVQAALGWPGGHLAPLAITLGASALVTVALWGGALLWNRVRAPMRLLTDDVIAIRERVEATPLGSAKTDAELKHERAVRAALTAILAELENIHDWIADAERGDKWSGYGPSTMEGYQRNGLIGATAGLQHVHASYRKTYKAVNGVYQRSQQKALQAFDSEDRKLLADARQAVEDAIGVFQVALRELGR
jgi:hypothetical protein